MTISNNTIAEDDIANRGCSINTNDKSAWIALDGTIGYHNVLARSKIIEFFACFQGNAIITADDIAVGNAYTSAPVDIDSVAFWVHEVSTNSDAVYSDIFATAKSDRPERAIFESDIMKIDIATADKKEEERTGIGTDVDASFISLNVICRLVLRYIVYECGRAHM